MSELLQLTPRERAVLDINTPDKMKAIELAKIAEAAGAKYVKMGEALLTATSWEFCSSVATRCNLDWIADARLNGLTTHMVEKIRSFRYLSHNPMAITINPDSGVEAMKACQEEALRDGRDIKILGSTALGLMKYKDAVKNKKYFIDQTGEIVESGINGIVCSSCELELPSIRNANRDDFLVMTQGVDVDGVGVSWRRGLPNTPMTSILNHAHLVVLGDEVTKAENVADAYEDYVLSMEAADSLIGVA